ncbi:hypothetical protein ACFFTN_25900 [Aminobacter aganoensis]|uniref:Uncharacterized protein n=1 Tax=Aminobacter aganoensis TaxID=83264 RepID=A0A7X0F7R4_9HYPH|nr:MULTISPECIES: hypothetical protein [Aminobacter]MBB6354701.1 hypothetical protein [Aminobacter aganoensis]
MTMKLSGHDVDLDEPATVYEDRFTPGLFFSHLSQAIRYVACIPIGKQSGSVSIVSQSGLQFGVAEINVLHDHLLRSRAAKANPTAF